MAEIPIHPVETEKEQDSYYLDLILRIKLLDITNGKPITDGYAIKPVISSSIFQRYVRFPLRILNTRIVNFTNSDTGNFAGQFKTIRVFAPSSGSNPPTALNLTWQCAPEFIHLKEDGHILSDTRGNIFQQIDSSDERYICVKSSETKYCEPALITNKFGVLEIPINYSDLVNNSSLKIEFRDYVIAKAEGEFSPVSGHDPFDVSLTGNPIDNIWSAKKGSEILTFSNQIDLSVSFTGLASHLINVATNKLDLTLWAIRKVKRCDSSACTGFNNRPAGATVLGIVIHYNSGYYISECRGSGSVLCRNIFDNGNNTCYNDNKYFSSPELCLQILKKLFTSGKTGYHYHIDRNGEIISVVDEDKRVYHSGKSREPLTVIAEKNSGGATLTTSHTSAMPTEQLDNNYIGINLTGHHNPAKYHFTDHQHWYLDRLIENIRSRRSEIEWYSILGHDEVRGAYIVAHPSTTEMVKTDPGNALAGGMRQLRGRHGANFT